MAYRRFRHFGKDKVTMDFAFFAIAFNLKKMCAKMAKERKGTSVLAINALFILLFILYAKRKGTDNKINIKNAA